jgi:hypothetical protein
MGEGYSFDLPDGRSEIFFQMGLDKQFCGSFGDLPVGQIRRVIQFPRSSWPDKSAKRVRAKRSPMTLQLKPAT